MSASALTASTRPGFREHPVEWALTLFADVRPGEGTTALVLMVDVMLLLTAYYLLKVAREPLILTSGGAEVKSYAAVGQSLLLIGVASAYGWLAQKVDRIRLITYVTLFFASNLVVFWGLGSRGFALGIPFFLWVGVFNLSVIAQFWSFAADVYSPSEGKRLLPILGIGSSVGAVVGAGIARLLFRLGPYDLMVIAAGLLLFCLGLTYVAHRRESARARVEARVPEAPMSGESGFALLLKDRYLILVGMLSVILNAVNNTGEYVLDRALIGAASHEAASLGLTASQYIGKFKAEYFEYVNVAAVSMQLFAVSRIIKYIGVRAALFVMPIVSLAGYGALAVVPVLGVALAVKVAENGLDYSLANTARQALWLVTSRDAKYKVKQVIDTFLVRAGDLLAAALVWAGTHFLAFGARSFVLFNAAQAVVWAIVVWRLTHRYAAKEGA